MICASDSSVMQIYNRMQENKKNKNKNKKQIKRSHIMSNRNFIESKITHITSNRNFIEHMEFKNKKQ